MQPQKVCPYWGNGIRRAAKVKVKICVKYTLCTSGGPNRKHNSFDKEFIEKFLCFIEIMYTGRRNYFTLREMLHILNNFNYYFFRKHLSQISRVRTHSSRIIFGFLYKILFSFIDFWFYSFSSYIKYKSQIAHRLLPLNTVMTTLHRLYYLLHFCGNRWQCSERYLVGSDTLSNPSMLITFQSFWFLP